MLHKYIYKNFTMLFLMLSIASDISKLGWTREWFFSIICASFGQLTDLLSLPFSIQRSYAPWRTGALSRLPQPSPSPDQRPPTCAFLSCASIAVRRVRALRLRWAEVSQCHVCGLRCSSLPANRVASVLQGLLSSWLGNGISYLLGQF